MFNITPAPTVLETIAWLAYLVPVLIAFLLAGPPARSPHRPARRRAERLPDTSENPQHVPA